MGNLYNPDVRYSFNIPIEDKPQQFFWDAYGPWQECSRLCQGEGEAQVGWQGEVMGVVNDKWSGECRDEMEQREETWEPLRQRHRGEQIVWLNLTSPC